MPAPQAARPSATEDAIVIEGVSKAYRHYARPLDRLRELVVRRKLHVERHSISDVSFRIGRGEVVGIIGRNGAGKSTLLKMIAGRLEPSAGRVHVSGSIAAILELGTGFHPDLSGRENVRVGGLCMGLTRAQIEREMQNIIDFAELESVIDMPFKTYSSGMQARLTFATAITVDPDILIIDEALSVGDNKFQLKSFSRIRKFKDEGKTILVVTHGMGTVTSFCDRAILLDNGKVIADGDPNWVTSVYHHLQFGEYDPALGSQQDPPPAAVSVVPQEAPDLPAGMETVPAEGSAPDASGHAAPEAGLPCETTIEDAPAAEPVAAIVAEPPQQAEVAAAAEPARDAASDGARPAFTWATSLVQPRLSPDPEVDATQRRQGYRYGDRRASILGVTVLDNAGHGPIRELRIGREYQFVMDCRTNEPLDVLYCGYLVRDPKGDILFGGDTTLGEVADLAALSNLADGDVRRAICRVRCWLAPGDYFLTAATTATPGKQSDMWFDAYEFRVVGPAIQHTNSRVFLEPSFRIVPLEADAPVEEAAQ